MLTLEHPLSGGEPGMQWESAQVEFALNSLGPTPVVLATGLQADDIKQKKT